jgi:hypothetical protein
MKYGKITKANQLVCPYVALMTWTRQQEGFKKKLNH